MTGIGNKNRRYTASAKDVAEMFDVTRATVYNWLKSESPPPHIRIGGVVRFDIAEVEEWARTDKAA